MKTSLVLGLVGLLACGCSKDRKPDAPSPAPASSSAAVSTLALTVPDAGDVGRGRHKKGHEDRFEPGEDAGAATVQVKVGGVVKTWSRAQLDSVPKYTLGAKNNEGENRDTWSLRELAHALVGPNARVVMVAGPDETKTVDKAAWDDPKRTPVLHTTRRGTLKYRWADAKGEWGDTEVRDVTQLELAP
jgi:hypothetical protein